MNKTGISAVAVSAYLWRRRIMRRITSIHSPFTVAEQNAASDVVEQATDWVMPLICRDQNLLNTLHMIFAIHICKHDDFRDMTEFTDEEELEYVLSMDTSGSIQ